VVDRLRRRILAAILVTTPAVSACEERERWPDARERPQPKPIAPPEEGECLTGSFCVPLPAEVVVSAPAPHEICELRVRLPDEVARELPEDERRRLQIRFDGEASQSSACCYRWMEHCRGRPFLVAPPEGVALLVARAPRLAAARVGTGWPSRLRLPAALDPRSCADASALGRLWLCDAAHEHASIAAFARAALSLQRLGAPPALVMACHRAARDEVRHARFAYAIASHLLGEPHGPDRLRLDGASVLDADALALDTFVGGCVAETVAACIAREAAHRPTPLRAWLARIADDEERHAVLAWRTLRWLLPHCRADTRAAMADAATGPIPVDDGAAGEIAAAEQWGVLSPATRRALTEAARQRLIEPLTQTIMTVSATRACAAQPSTLG
jgi:hypothetical protein